MISLDRRERFLFVIDTEQQSEAFDKQLCAYVTGKVGESGVGRDEAAEFAKDTFFKEGINPDRHPFHYVYLRTDPRTKQGTPCTPYPTPGWFDHGLGGVFRDGDEKKALDAYREACHREADKLFLGDRKMWEELSKTGKLVKLPAFMSVAIFMMRAPTPEEWTVLENRTKGFVRHWNALHIEQPQFCIDLTGFRLVSEETQYVCVKAKAARFRTPKRLW